MQKSKLGSLLCGETHREAKEGFNVCGACGFENFKRTTFCTICGSTIGKEGKKRAKKLKYKNPLNTRYVRARFVCVVATTPLLCGWTTLV